MAKDVTNPVTSYSITLLGSAFGKVRGWLELKNGKKDAGYIWLTEVEPLPKDGLGGSAGSEYVVMYRPGSMLGTLIDILRHEKPLYIRFFDPGTGDAPSTFFGSSPAEKVTDVKSLEKFMKE